MRDRANAETPKTGPGGEVAVCVGIVGEARVDVPVKRKAVWAGRWRMARAFHTASWTVPMNLRDVFARREPEAELIDWTYR